MENRQSRFGWIDLLRTVACLMVVLAHCCDPYVAQFDADRTSFLSGALIGSLMRPSVPLFVMMTGVLLLPVRDGLGAFYRKRVGRILTALVFWSLTLPLLYHLYVHAAAPATSLDPAAYTWSATWTKIRSMLFNFTYETTPLWYLYMLAGLYLVMPVLSAWAEQASRRDLKILLGVWGLTLLVPYLRLLAPLTGYEGNYGNMGLYGICDWNEFGTFHYVSGFAGYLLLAWYLVKYPPRWSRKRLACYGGASFVAGYLITALGFIALQRHFPGDYAYLEIVWYFSGINVFLMTWPLFVLASRLHIRPRMWLKRLAEATFGIYLCHFVLVQIGYDLLGGITALPVALRIAVTAAAAFGASYLLVRLLLRFRWTRIFVR